MSVTVVMTAYDAASHLAAAVESVLSQTCGDFELLIVDDGSTDATPDILERYRRQDARIRIVSQPNRGMAAALNRALEETQARWVARMDADDVMLPRRIERQMAFAEGHPELAVGSCLVYYIDARGRRIGKSYSDLTTPSNVKKYVSQNKLIGLHHPGALLRRQTVLDVGGYRGQFWPADDIDLWNRIAEKDVLILVQQEYLLEYRIHSRSVSIGSVKDARLKFRWVKECMLQRRQGSQEPSLEEFLALEKSRPLWTRANRLRKDLARILYKDAVCSYSRKRYVGAVTSLLAATTLEPAYPMRQVRRKWSRLP